MKSHINKIKKEGVASSIKSLNYSKFLFFNEIEREDNI